jgi:thiamine biosynthesis lipoprotein
MRRTEIIMGMPITVVVPEREREDRNVDAAAEAVFAFFRRVDERFSPYKADSETSKIGRREIPPSETSPEMQEVLRLSEETRRMTNGYFNVWFQDRFDPSGLVKGWAITRAAEMLDSAGFVSFSIEAGGDIETRGANDDGQPWSIGIRNPFDPSTIIRTVKLTNQGIATSGTYVRGEHIYNPRTGEKANEIASLTVIGPNAYEADRFATAAFAMGRAGVEYVAGLTGLDAYMVEWSGTATLTPGFAGYVEP